MNKEFIVLLRRAITYTEDILRIISWTHYINSGPKLIALLLMVYIFYGIPQEGALLHHKNKYNTENANISKIILLMA